MEHNRKRQINNLETPGFASERQHGFRNGKFCLINLREKYDRLTEIRQRRVGQLYIPRLQESAKD